MYKSKFVQCREEINKICNVEQFEQQKTDALLVHAEIFDEFKNLVLKLKQPLIDQHIWDFDLFIDGIEVPMKLMWMPNDEIILFQIIVHAQYSYPWKRNTTLYVPVQRISLVKKFIKLNKLQPLVERITTDRTHLFLDQDIKIVQFHTSIPVNTIDEFQSFLRKMEYTPPINRFIKYAFSYLQPKFLKYYDKPFYNPGAITQVLLLLDYHRANGGKGVEIFDLLDLIAMKMAIDDNRFEYENCEFHKLIDKIIREMADRQDYIKLRCFDLEGYRSDRAIYTQSSELYQYLIYNFNLQFDQVTKYDHYSFKLKLSKNNKIDAILESADNFGYVTLDVDSAYLNESSGSVILKCLLYKHELFTFIIHFDTEHSWWYDGGYSVEKCHYVFGKLRLYALNFSGPNSEYFIENFFNWMKYRLGPVWKNFTVSFVGTPIFYPYVLNDIFVSDLSLHNVELNYKLISALANSGYQRLMIVNCWLSKDYKVFEALDKLRRVWSLIIAPVEYFFEILMEYLREKFTTENIFEFQFKYHLKYNGMELSSFNFVLSKDRNEITTIDLDSHQVVYIFEYLYGHAEPETKADFSFYK